ncbi:retropepsin-like aspartic protease [Pedobacter hartonius]|uniref:Aspartyl protease n=1 Tax=Pedobacter hartonius TaxID=425514 RepID=A0A1H4HL00_9SPHI|nr:retropepsin-like aspartic protease [Pedobacter hartonius]SEB21718.1 Aspartyl protease [Pedobacter hartonius]
MKLKQGILIATLLLNGITIASAQIAQIPFEFNGKHIFVKVLTNQSDTLRYIFDTGATTASIDSATAERSGISKDNRRTVTAEGSGDSQNYSMALHQSLKLNTIEMKDVNLLIVNFASLSAKIGSKLDGVIGYEILNKYTTQFDFDQKKIFLYDQIKSVDTTGYTAIPFEFSKNILIPRFPVSITLTNGEVFTGKVMFDTGSIFTLVISSPFSKYHNLERKIGKTHISSSTGLNAITKDQVAVIKGMSFNGFEFGSMDVRLTLNENAVSKDGYLGILGIEIIKHFNVIVDYANKKIYLKPNSAYRDKISKG